MNQRENYLAVAKGGKGEFVPSFTDDANVFAMPFWFPDPVTKMDFMNIKWVTNDAGKMPDENHRAMEDITKWREIINFPVLSELDWEGMAKNFHDNKDPDKVNIAMLNTAGLFLIPINMMGWVDGLCAIYEEPEELEALISRLTDFLLEIMTYYKKYIKPDIIFTGDDLASATGPFISSEVWEKMYKPYFKKLIDSIHDAGALCEFHNCGNNSWLIDEYIRMGVDICQLPEPNDELMKNKEEYKNRLVITGGWDRHGEGSMPFASEEAVRKSVRDAIDTWGKDGGLIFWDGGIVGTSEDSNNKRKWVADELENYGKRKEALGK